MKAKTSKNINKYLISKGMFTKLLKMNIVMKLLITIEGS